jgi:xanthine dehydrogenase/oxidase
MDSHDPTSGDHGRPLLYAAAGAILVALAYRLLARLGWPFSRPSPRAAASETGGGRSRLEDVMWSNVLTLFLNGAEIKITNPDPSELLAGFIRDKAGLKGTKLGCEEGGCGACTVVLTKPDETMSVNACLRPLCANDGFAVTTVEGIGSIKEGLSTEQSTIVEHNGTQCGYCTPGWVATKHALNVQSEADGTKVSDRELEAYLDGNICRCTGYRAILKGFQQEGESGGGSGGCGRDPASCSAHGTSACTSDSTCSHAIEDLHSAAASCPPKAGAGAGAGAGVGKRSTPLGSRRAKALVSSYAPQPLCFTSPDGLTKWYRPIGLDQMCSVLQAYHDCAVQLVGGNTSIGVSKYLNNTTPYNTADAYSVFVDVNSIPEMVSTSFDSNSCTLTVGAAVTINALISKLNEFGSKKLGSDNVVINHRSIFDVTANHLTKIANTQVRNAASWAGNLMLFKKYPTFPSDAVVALTNANAILTLCNTAEDASAGGIKSISMDEFLCTDFAALAGWVVMSLSIADTSRRDQKVSYCVSETFKVAQRSRNAHAQVNSGFNFELVPSFTASDGPMIRAVRVVFGGVSKNIFIARQTERALAGSRVNQATLGAALAALQRDLALAGPSDALGDEQFRISVMQSNLYMALLRCVQGSLAHTNLMSAVLPWLKPTSRGTEVFSEAAPCSPVGKAIPKLESRAQATGEAVYPSDEAMPAQGLHAALIYASRCAVALSAIDASAAMMLEGVVAVYTAADIPGENVGGAEGLKLFAEIGAEVECVGFPVGVVVATTEAIANRASALVQLSYRDIGKVPIVSLADAIAKKSFFPMVPMVRYFYNVIVCFVCLFPHIIFMH